MTLDATLRPVATRLIANYGRPVTLTRNTSGDYDPTSGTAKLDSEDITVNAVVDRYDSASIANGSVEVGDVRLLVEDIDPPPAVGDSFQVGGQTLQAVSVLLISTGLLNGYSEVQARRA